MPQCTSSKQRARKRRRLLHTIVVDAAKQPEYCDGDVKRILQPLLGSVGPREADHGSGLLREALLHAGDDSDCEEVEVKLERLVGDEARDDGSQVLELRRRDGQMCVAERVANCLPEQLWQRASSMCD